MSSRKLIACCLVREPTDARDRPQVRRGRCPGAADRAAAGVRAGGDERVDLFGELLHDLRLADAGAAIHWQLQHAPQSLPIREQLQPAVQRSVLSNSSEGLLQLWKGRPEI